VRNKRIEGLLTPVDQLAKRDRLGRQLGPTPLHDQKALDLE
jgi:hypothetical protein